MPSNSQHSGRGGDPRDRRFERPQTPERRVPMAFPKGAPAAAPASGRHGDPAAYRRPREGGYGGGSHHADKKKHDGERKRRRHHDKDKADREARHAEKKRRTVKVEKEKKEKPKEEAPPAKGKRADSSGDDDSSSSSSDSKETVKVEERPQPKVDVDNTGGAASSSGAGQIMVSAISSRMDEMTAVAMSFSRSLVGAQQALRTSARIARDAAMGFESEMENFSRAEKEINETFGLKFDRDDEK